MTLYSGNLTGDATPYATLLSAIATDVDAETAWSLVESYDNGTYTYKVMKCDHTVSGLPNDYHVTFYTKNSSPTFIGVQMHESYNVTTHKMIQPTLAGTTYAATASDCSKGTTEYTLPTTSSTSISCVNHSLTGATTWELIVGTDYISLSVHATHDWTAFFGTYTSMIYTAATNDPMPLIHWSSEGDNIGGNGLNNLIGSTRSPLNPSTSSPGSYGWLMFAKSWHGYYGPANYSSATDITTIDKYQAATGAHPVAEPLMVHNNAAAMTTNASVIGFTRGKINNAVFIYAGSAVLGDTLTIGSDTYHYTSLGVVRNSTGSQYKGSIWVKG